MNVGRYQMVRLLGQGGMASVYEACEPSLNRRVAIKVLHAEMSKDSEVIARFSAEGRIVNGIRHPSLVPVHEQGQLQDGSYYIVMDLLEGETLSRRLARSVHRPLSLEEVLRIARQVTEALATVHRHGVVHRDIKPDNLMLVSDPAVSGGVRVKILDFGLAKVQRARAGTEPPKTVVGCAYGTISYMAPEQMFDARGATDRADVYSLGNTIFEMVTGRSPFPGTEPLQIWGAQLTKPAPDLREFVPTAPRDLALLVQRMLNREPVHRPSMEDVLRRLDWLYQSQSAGGTPNKPGEAPPGAKPSQTLTQSSSDNRTILQPVVDTRQPPARALRPLIVAALVAMPLLGLVYSCTPGSASDKAPRLVPANPQSTGSPGSVTPVRSPTKRSFVQVPRTRQFSPSLPTTKPLQSTWPRLSMTSDLAR